MKKLAIAMAVALAEMAAPAGGDCRRPFGAPVTVKARERVEVSFRARVVKGACLEAFPDYRSMMTLVACSPYRMPEGSRFPGVDLAFSTAEGVAVRQPWVTQASVLVWSREWRTYRHSAFVPEGAAKAQLSVIGREKGNVVEIADLKFTRTDPFAEPVRAINPMIDYGLFNTSGYSFMGVPRWRTTPEGKDWFDLLQGSCYPDPFPVKGGERLQVRFHGDSPTWLHCYVCFYPDYKDIANLNMNKKFFVLDVHNKRHHPERIEKIEVPADATWARVYFQPHGKIEDFRIVADKEGK